VGDAETLLNLLAVFEVPNEIDDSSEGQCHSQVIKGEGQANIEQQCFSISHFTCCI
jgi:hypothetical protein